MAEILFNLITTAYARFFLLFVIGGFLGNPTELNAQIINQDLPLNSPHCVENNGHVVLSDIMITDTIECNASKSISSAGIVQIKATADVLLSAPSITLNNGLTIEEGANLQITSTRLIRGPYLQSSSDNRITVIWQTGTAVTSQLYYGTTINQINILATDNNQATKHRIKLTDLQADTKYYYRVQLANGLSEINSFKTAPLTGSNQPVRIWVIGDSGTANANARSVRDAFKAFTQGTTTDLWLMLGDNAYNLGTDAEYQRAVFDTYPQLLSNTVLWPTLGNHDGYSADASSQTGPYFDIFELPTQGEAGGVASGTEAYYSFDYANIHFICLDSYGSDRSVNAPMYQWLEADLAANQQTWTIAFWHHPPYSKGSHDSDLESRLIDMRENFNQLLEGYGVDLVLGGHSHSYERSVLLDGHYDLSPTYDALTHAINAGDGSLLGNGIYTKDNIAHDGAVYVVAGSSGKTSEAPLDHPVMYRSLPTLGSLVIDVKDKQLNAQFLDNQGNMPDSFSLNKDVAYQAPIILSAEFNANADLYISDQNTLNNGLSANADGDDNGQELVALFNWNINTLPELAQIHSVKLDFNVTNQSPGVYQLFAINYNWTELNADWSVAQTPGALLGSFSPTTIKPYTLTLNTAANRMVKSWLDNNLSLGVMLRAADTTDGVDISTREAANPAKLTVYYSVAPP